MGTGVLVFELHGVKGASKKPPGGSAGGLLIASGSFKRTEASSQRGANLVGDGLESGWIGAGDVGEDLAVHFDPGLLKAVDKSGIGEALEAGGRSEERRVGKECRARRSPDD